MNAIKIDAANKVAIEAALRAVNGDATEHTFTKFNELAQVADDLEDRVLDIVGGMSMMSGATSMAVSGEAIPRGVDAPRRRRATQVCLERREDGWYLTNVAETSVGKKGGGKPELTLTPEQGSAAVEHRDQLIAERMLEETGIKVKPENADYIEAALRALNGTVVDRVFMKFSELQDLVSRAENVSEESGERTMAFAVKRKTSTLADEICAAQLQVERRADGWYLVDIAHTSVEKPSDETPVLRIGRGGTRPGAGRPAIPGLSQYKLTLDEKAYAVFQEYGEGNASLGARKLAQHAYESALIVGLREDVDDALQGLAEASGVSTGEVVEQLVLEAWVKVSTNKR